MDIRSRTATGQRESRFGGLATLLTGDFFQLPHPTKPSLATPVDAETRDLARCSDEGVAEQDKDEKDKANEKETAQSEHRAGKEAWLAIPKVVMLSLNLRSPGVLANILRMFETSTLLMLPGAHCKNGCWAQAGEEIR